LLPTLAILLTAAVVAVPLSRRAGFGSILGYLVAGVLIGPAGLSLVSDVEEIREISELGVIMLLFLIGLELRPQRLWVMRRAVFGLGSGQVAITAAALAGLILAAFTISWQGALVLGLGLALSSTAIVLPMLAERDLLGSAAGRDAFSVLLFQDLAFIPLVAVVPLLGGASLPGSVPWIDVLRMVAGVSVILVGGRFLLRPAFRAIGGAKTPEVFTAMALLTVVGTAALAHAAGLSTSLGAFLAGVLLSESEYRHELQADIEPFEGLLLGFFFMSVGMSANLGLALSDPALIALGLLCLLGGKILLGVLLGKIAGQGNAAALRFGFAIGQGSEFSFVIFTAAVAAGALAKDQADRATLVIALSMAATPILFAGLERFIIPRLRPEKHERPYDDVISHGTPVIICGFGRVGQIVGRMLRMRGIGFTALEQDAGQVDVVRRFGSKVYFGNPTRAEVLRAAGADTAKLLVVALADMEQTLAVVDVARRHFPQVKIVARARNRRHAHLLMDREVTAIVRETFHSSLRLSEVVLTELGVDEAEAHHMVDLFQQHDEQTLLSQHADFRDEQQLIQSTQEAAAELANLFEADRSEADTTDRPVEPMDKRN
jgi:monovalent cation:proton antiporter-2 (CPA2) family protein